MKFLALICCLVVYVTWCTADPVQVHDCGSVEGSIINVDISPCPALPCPFKKSTFVNVSITYNASTAITQAKTSVHGIIANIPVPFPLPDDNACDFMTCPINKGQIVKYKNGIAVSPAYPAITLIVKWELVDQISGSDIICFTVPVSITS